MRVFFLFFFSLFFPLFSQEHRLQAKNANIVLVRSGSEIQDGLASVCTCRPWQTPRSLPGAEANRRPHLLHFKQQPAPASCAGPGCMFFFFITNDLFEWNAAPAYSLLAFKREEITDDDIRVGESEGEGETTWGGETLDLFVLGKWYPSANFLLISIWQLLVKCFILARGKWLLSLTAPIDFIDSAALNCILSFLEFFYLHRGNQLHILAYRF